MAYRSNYNNTFSSASSAGGGLQFLNSPFGDTTLTKVFVGGLAWETKSETLHRHFERFGEILEAVVITDKNTGRSKGYGFVTFRDPEAARRACFDQNPVIDGRRANCNLASLGRPQPIPFYGRPRPGYPYFASAQGPQGGYMGSPMYPLPVSYNNQQGFAYHPYGYAAYGSDYVYPQGVYNPYVGQQYLQMYGSPETPPTAMHPYGQVRQSIPGNPGYTAAHAYAIPSHQIVQYGGPSINEVTTATNPTIQAPYPTVLAAPVPSQTQIVVPAHSHKPTHGSSSDQTARS